MLLLVLIVALLPPSEAVVDCRIACRRCRENREHAVLLEVHCAMCQECKLRRKQMIHGLKLPPQSEMAAASADPMLERGVRRRTAHGATTGDPSPMREGHHEDDGTAYEEQYPEGCPTPPPCQSESDERERFPLKLPTTTTTTTEKTCPPVITCRRPKRTTTTTTRAPRPPRCNPCMPMCMIPCVQNPPPPAQAPPATCNPPAPTLAPPGQPTTSDYYYVYLGVPKHLLRTG